GANIASSTRADTAYFNPANMAWMEDTWHVEVDATYIFLSEIDYEDNRPATGGLADGNSEEENFFVPTGFVVSPSYGGARFGLAIVAPAGLTKRWKDPYQKSFAEKFSLMVIEVNPTVSYSFGNMVSIAAGPRMLYAEAEVRSSSYDTPLLGDAARDMDDDTLEWGWNAALAVKPIEELNLSATYRSKVDLDFNDNDAKLSLGPASPMNPFFNKSYNSYVGIPVPAVFALSAAYDVLDNLNVEFTWDRTFWSDYDELDFDFSANTPPSPPSNPFDESKPKDWDDTNAFRIGVTWEMNETWTLMGGFAYDENPAPAENINFELPDSDAWIYSIGAQYKVSEQMDVGMAALYDYKESREVKNAEGSVDGNFTNASAFLISVGMNYRF
ncbi:MAG: aromatic hydrocarbon degradation protein, partial [Desulfobulbaceae bacterium]|nr:aromatic hydrocarbon degradation protein [Desulfobulbaceae bacterium]